MRFSLASALAWLMAAQLAPTYAAAAPVSGTVAGANGFTLLVMGRTRVVKAVKLDARGRFTANGARDVTLQLLRPDNTFFGPVVLAHAGGRAYEALAGRRLAIGTIRLRAGYAMPSRRLGMSAVDPHVWARADRSGKPVGAGNLGLLAHRRGLKAKTAEAGGPQPPGGPQPGSQPGAGSQPGSQPGGGSKPGGESTQTLPPGGDPTHVGIPTAFNADVTGAGVPNAENPASAQTSGDGLFTEIFMPLQMSVNTDAVGVTPAQVSDLVKSDLRMNFWLDGHAAGGAPVSGASVDCGTLVYCASGAGTATTSNAGLSRGVPAGVQWDGSVPAEPSNPGVFFIQIVPNVGNEQIHPGDVFLVHFHTPAGDVIQATTLTMFFLTVPAVATYNVGAGTQAPAYPVAQTAPGTPGNPIMMTSGSITLSVWRPQRAALPGETGPFIDVGHLHYGVPLRAPGSNQPGGCGPQFYSGLSPSLQVAQNSQDPNYNKMNPLHDTTDDAPSNPANQIGFTLDVAGCMAANGIPTTAPISLPISAVDESRRGGTDSASQTITVCLPGCDPSLRSTP